MIQPPPTSTLTDTLFPYTTLFRSISTHDVEIIEAEYPVQIAIGLVRKLKFLCPVSNIALIKRSPLPQRSSVRVEVEFVQRLSARGDGDELDRAEILVKAQRQTPAFGSHQLLYITHGIKFARIKRHAIGWRSEESRVGKECGSTGRSRWWRYNK